MSFILSIPEAEVKSSNYNIYAHLIHRYVVYFFTYS